MSISRYQVPGIIGSVNPSNSTRYEVPGTALPGTVVETALITGGRRTESIGPTMIRVGPSTRYLVPGTVLGTRHAYTKRWLTPMP